MLNRLVCAGVFLFCAVCAGAATWQEVTIVTANEASGPEANSAALLQQRLAGADGPQVTLVKGDDIKKAKGLIVLFGIPSHHEALTATLDANRIAIPDETNPGPEGYLLRFAPSEWGTVLLAAAVDDRGALYAVGEILRQAQCAPGAVELPDAIDVRTAPAFEVRGTQVGQSHIAKNLAHVRDWTDEEMQRAILDYALAGANTFEPPPGPLFDFVRSYGLMTQENYGPNTGSGPPEWQAEESIGRTGYLCPSVPEARAALLQRCDDYFRAAPHYDFVKFFGGDGGGCECDKCDPYGGTFIRLCEDMAAIVHKYHPDARVWFTNQKFDDADDKAIFEYLQEKPRDWLWAWGYGPGSDAMSWQPGHRQTHRMDLFRYAGFGPFDRYNQEIMHQLPPQQTLMHYNEITHWRYSQHGYVQMYPRPDKNGDLPPWQNHFMYERRPDQALTMVYDRLTFYAWPKFYYWLFGEVNRYGVGDITHSSGHHDHFNNWMWQRRLFAPQLSLEDIVDSYCRTWFGPEAAQFMAEALYQLEENLEEDRQMPITQKAGIDSYYDLVAKAGDAMASNRMAGNWLWREYMQKGALDKYTKLQVIQQTNLQAEIERRVATALDTDLKALPTAELVAAIDSLTETPEMAALREEAGRLGDESNALYGVRSEGYFNLKHDFIGLGWLKRQLTRSAEASSAEEKRELLRMIVAYEDAGEGGYYDNLGTFNPCPNVVAGSPYDHGQPYVFGMLDEGNRPSQRSMHSTQEQAQGVTLEYRDLDPAAQYRIRFTFVRPWFQERYAMRMNQKSQSIYADDIEIAHEVELPLQMSDFFTYEIPREATKDGEVTIRLEKAADVANGDRVSVEQWRNSGGWGTLCSEAWLMKAK